MAFRWLFPVVRRASLHALPPLKLPAEEVTVLGGTEITVPFIDGEARKDLFVHQLSREIRQQEREDQDQRNCRPRDAAALPL